MFHVTLKLRLVDLNYNFECDWLIQLSDNKLCDTKLSDNNLASEFVQNKSFFKPITIEEIVTCMINRRNFCFNFTWSNTEEPAIKDLRCLISVIESLSCLSVVYLEHVCLAVDTRLVGSHLDKVS